MGQLAMSIPFTDDELRPNVYIHRHFRALSGTILVDEDENGLNRMIILREDRDGVWGEYIEYPRYHGRGEFQAAYVMPTPAATKLGCLQLMNHWLGRAFGE